VAGYLGFGIPKSLAFPPFPAEAPNIRSRYSAKFREGMKEIARSVYPKLLNYYISYKFALIFLLCQNYSQQLILNPVDLLIQPKIYLF